MTNMDPAMEPIFTKMIPCPGVGILKMIPCSAARPRTEKYMSTPPPGTESVAAFVQLCLGTGHSTNGYMEIRLAPSLFRGESASRNIGTSAGT